VTNTNRHNHLSDSILDALRGESSPEDARAIAARCEADPALARERDRIGRLLTLERAAQTAALADVLDARAAERMAARILDRARRSDDRRSRAPAPRSLWVRLLAVSVAAHVLALGFFSWRHFHPRPPAPDEAPDALYALHRDEPELTSPGGEPASDGAPPETAVAGRYVLPDDGAPIPGEIVAGPAPDVLDMPVRPLMTFPRGSARAMWVRTNDSLKRAIDARVGSPGALERVKSGLAALARVQASDGSFVDETGTASARATATVLLAFLGDGHSSFGGEHRAVVERGIAWLSSHLDGAEAKPGDRALGLFALSEDLILSSGSMTPAQSRATRLPLVALAQSVADARASDRSGSPDARWADLALEAAARAGVRSVNAVAVAASIDVASIRPTDDVRTAMLDGSVLLKDPRVAKDRRGPAFTEWNAATMRLLGARLGADGMAKGTSSRSERATETALVLLAFEVAYRTY